METGSDNRCFPFADGPNNAISLGVSRTTATDLRNLVETAYGFASSSTAVSTQRAYRSDWRRFATWCAGFGFDALPASPEVVALYVTSMASDQKKPATIARALAAISVGHQAAGHESPTASTRVRMTMRGLRRRLGSMQVQKAPLLASQLRTVLTAIPDDLSGARDRALLLIGFAGGFRRSELVGLDVADVAFTADGLVVSVKRSKTDQEGRGRIVGIPFGSTPGCCPVRSLRRWLEVAGINSGPVFRGVGRWGQISSKRLSDQMVAKIVKKHVSSLGLDASLYSGHSLRAGLATSAARAGRSERSIMMTTGHKSAEMVRRYIRAGSLFVDNAAAGLL